jgi:hypothetical protein
MDKGRFAFIYVPDFSEGTSPHYPPDVNEGLSSYLRIGATVDDDFTWRDHTDGNRVTTTRGDKIEVIEGSYQLFIHSRSPQVEPPKRLAGWKEEDGNLLQSGVTFLGSANIEKRKRGRGRKIDEKTVRGEMHTLYHGDVFEESYGSVIQRVIGAEVPTVIQGLPPAAGTVLKENPEIVDRTWARRIESYTGSQGARVPSIRNVVWAGSITSETHGIPGPKAGGQALLKATADVEQASSSSTTARSMTDKTEVAGAITDTTVADTITEKTTAKKITSETHADTDDEKQGDGYSYTRGDSLVSVEGAETTLNLPVVDEIVAGAMNEITLGVETSMLVGGSLDVSLAAEVELSLTAALLCRAGIKVELTPVEIRISLDKTRLELSRRSVAAVHLFP